MCGDDMTGYFGGFGFGSERSRYILSVLARKHSDSSRLLSQYGVWLGGSGIWIYVGAAVEYGSMWVRARRFYFVLHASELATRCENAVYLSMHHACVNSSECVGALHAGQRCSRANIG